MVQFNPAAFSDTPRSPYVAYLRDSSQPVTALIFLAPVLLIYHFGVWQLSREQMHLANGADLTLARMLNFLFFTGLKLLEKIAPTLTEPDGWAIYLLRGGSSLFTLALLVMVLLFRQHLAPAPWRMRSYTLPLMLLECAALTLPIFALEWLVRLFDAPAINLIAAAGNGEISPRTVGLIMSTGAGVYEEFLFRGLLLPLLFMVGKKICGGGNNLKYAAILGQAVAFAGFHYLLGMNENFHWGIFTFRILAGIYFAYLWQERDFAITAGSHAAYDVIATGVA